MIENKSGKFREEGKPSIDSYESLKLLASLCSISEPLCLGGTAAFNDPHQFKLSQAKVPDPLLHGLLCSMQNNESRKSYVLLIMSSVKSFYFFEDHQYVKDIDWLMFGSCMYLQSQFLILEGAFNHVTCLC